MSELFDLIQTSAVGRDYSCSYRLKFNKECKVSEFIDYLLINRSNEWGCVEVKPTTTTTEDGGFTIGRYYEKGNLLRLLFLIQKMLSFLMKELYTLSGKSIAMVIILTALIVRKNLKVG